MTVGFTKLLLYVIIERKFRTYVPVRFGDKGATVRVRGILSIEFFTDTRALEAQTPRYDRTMSSRKCRVKELRTMHHRTGEVHPDAVAIGLETDRLRSGGRIDVTLVRTRRIDPRTVVRLTIPDRDYRSRDRSVRTPSNPDFRFDDPCSKNALLLGGRGDLFGRRITIFTRRVITRSGTEIKVVRGPFRHTVRTCDVVFFYVLLVHRPISNALVYSVNDSLIIMRYIIDKFVIF